MTDKGWLYFAGVKDVFTCELVGYAMGLLYILSLLACETAHLGEGCGLFGTLTLNAT